MEVLLGIMEENSMSSTGIGVGIIKRMLYIKAFNPPLNKEEDYVYEDKLLTSLSRKENFNRPMGLYVYIRNYNGYNILNNFGITLGDYLKAPFGEIKILNDISIQMIKEENDMMEEVMGEDDER